ncbi:hypothetical protein HZA33_02555 [Candidatus Pacearchaeota archaeon]|nr:hypothetical protein [Candidatus Pacearchaeota archaeon]
MVKRLGRETIFNVLKEARDFYNDPKIREKIREKLSEDLPFKFDLNFFSFYFRKTKTIGAEGSAGEIRVSGEDESGQLQTRCFLGAENFPGLGEGYSVTSVLPSGQRGFFNVIKNEMEGVDAALHNAAMDFSVNTINAVKREKTGLLSYNFFDNCPSLQYQTTQRMAEMPALSDIEKIAKSISKKIEEREIEKRTSNVEIGIESEDRIFINSEGTEIIYDPELAAKLTFGARIKSDFGSLYAYTRMYEASWKRLFNEKNIDSMLNKFFEDLEEQKKAKKIPAGPYDVLFFNHGLATALHEAPAAHLCSLTYLLDQWSGAFSPENIGTKVTLEDITIESDPRAPGKGKWGYYDIDDEGIKSKKVVLVKEGKLTGLLSDRESASRLKVYRQRGKDIPLIRAESNGHGRIQDPSKPIEPRIGNLIIKTSKEKTFEELKKEFCELLVKRGKEYGLLLDCEAGSVGPAMDDEGEEISATTCVLIPQKAYIIYPDGKQEPALRKFNITVQPRDFLGKIHALGGDPVTENHLCGAESGYIRAMSRGPAGIVLDMPIEDWREEDYKRSIT